MNLLTIFVVLLFSVFTNGITNYNHAIACEHNTLNLVCKKNQVLDILKANYGRTRDSVCTNEPIKNLNCYQENSLSIVSNICQGKANCSLIAENNIFQDPCVGTLKYLFVLYRCVNAAKFKSALVCENKSIKLKCEPGSVVQIIEANYGRRSKFICSDGPVRTLHCINPDSVAKISNICKNKRECLIHASNQIFGDPCYGTLKYLSVKYKCSQEISDDEISSSIETLENVFKCANGPLISEDLLCNGIRDCPSGDDELDCKYISKVACEGNILEIKCDKKEKIQIVNSNYGRLTRNVCPYQNDQIIECTEFHSVNVLRQKCDEKNKCEIKAENEIFGDPCIGTYKYLQAYYKCIPEEEDFHKINPRST